MTGQHAGDGGGHAVQQGGAAGAHAALPRLSQRRRARPAAASQEQGGAEPARLRLTSQQGLDGSAVLRAFFVALSFFWGLTEYVFLTTHVGSKYICSASVT